MSLQLAKLQVRTIFLDPVSQNCSEFLNTFSNSWPCNLQCLNLSSVFAFFLQQCLIIFCLIQLFNTFSSINYFQVGIQGGGLVCDVCHPVYLSSFAISEINRSFLLFSCIMFLHFPNSFYDIELWSRQERDKEVCRRKGIGDYFLCFFFYTVSQTRSIKETHNCTPCAKWGVESPEAPLRGNFHSSPVK